MIDFLRDYDANVIAIMMLIVIYVISWLRAEVNNFAKRLLRIIIISNIIVLIVEPLTWEVDGMSGSAFHVLGYVTNSLMHVVPLVLFCLWFAYIDYKIHDNIKRIRRRYFYLFPAVVIFALMLINLFVPIIFSIDSLTNIYQRETLWFISFIIIYAMYAGLIAMVIKKRRQTNTLVIVSVLIFFILPFSSSLLQMIYDRFFYTYTTVSIAILISFIFLETISGGRDYLTGLYSRQSFDAYMHHLIEEGRTFMLLLIDLDNFKSVNDKYGHVYGDELLVDFSTMLSEVFDFADMIVRMGGDEFMVVLKEETPEVIASHIAVLHDKLANMPQLDHDLSFSHGYALYEEGLTFNEIYRRVDQKMYLEKHDKKTSM
ncbi:MAG: GGDEF domain-containing protein [Acholeplasmataceae bacterium]|nr:MAG: GGDEF domain-containing protein [Acholeplasmataceae bacterium]